MEGLCTDMISCIQAHKSQNTWCKMCQQLHWFSGSQRWVGQWIPFMRSCWNSFLYTISEFRKPHCQNILSLWAFSSNQQAIQRPKSNPTAIELCGRPYLSFNPQAIHLHDTWSSRSTMHYFIYDWTSSKSNFLALRTLLANRKILERTFNGRLGYHTGEAITRLLQA